jgi:methylase of polypeptide subunit release factors
VGLGPLALDRPDATARLRSTLAQIGYTGEAIRGVLGEDAYQSRTSEIAVHLRRLQARTPLETAIKLFFLGCAVPDADVEQALSPLGVAALQDLGLVHRNGEVVARVRLVPHAELLLAGSRYANDEADGTPHDYVATVTAPSAILATLTVRRPVRTTLDVGTGSGVQALWAARHSDHVVAIDVNPRALNIAAFNAQLNGVHNIEFRLGSMFEPVGDEHYDLILSNAPYVVSPDSRYAYRDGGLESDAFCERLVRGAIDHLEEGGFAQLLVSWLRVGDDWAERPRTWVAGSECDCWLLLGAERDPVTHAALWNEELKGDAAAFGDTLDRWVAYLHGLDADAVLEGALLLQRNTGRRHWFRADRIPAGRPEPAAQHVERVFCNQRLLIDLDETAILEQRPRLVESARIEQELHVRDRGYVVDAMTLVLDDGLGFRAGMDARTAALVPFLDGTRSVGAAIELAADTLGVDGDERQAFSRGAVEVVREMLELGFVVSS